MRTIGIEDIRQESWVNRIDNQLLIIEDLGNLPFSAPDEPMKNEVVIIGFCKSGSLRLSIDGNEMYVRSNSMFIIRPNTVLSGYMISPGLSGGAIVFSTQKVGKLLFLSKQVWKSMAYLQNNPVLEIGEDEQKLLQAYSDIGMYNLCHSDMRYNADMMQSLFQVFLYHLLNIIESHNPDMQEAEEGMNSSDVLFRRFIMLLNMNSGCMRSVKECADALNVTPKYLSQVVKMASGRTALDWIHEIICKEIEQQMRYSDRSVKEIAMGLDFTSLSAFGRFFKKHFEVSPTAYKTLVSTSCGKQRF